LTNKEQGAKDGIFQPTDGRNTEQYRHGLAFFLSQHWTGSHGLAFCLSISTTDQAATDWHFVFQDLVYTEQGAMDWHFVSRS